MALSHARDQYRARALATWGRLQRERPTLVTTNLVLAETHGLLARRAGPAVALAFAETLLVSPGPHVIWADEDLTRSALERWLRRYRDKALSLTDAVSFEVMQREGLRNAFAFDEDFERVGFRVV